VPLFFMGEEYGETRPFPFFCSFEDAALIEAVRRGRREEFASFAWKGEVPDPQGEGTFESAKLSWSWLDGTHHAGLRRVYRDLLAARHAWPALRDFSNYSATLLPHAAPPGVLRLARGDEQANTALIAYFNLGRARQAIPTSHERARQPHAETTVEPAGGPSHPQDPAYRFAGAQNLVT
jgi:maltooligosyltrehalose trehalohydrolase